MSFARTPSGEQTPLFNWPVRNGETWDAENKRHIYPTSKRLEAKNGAQHLDDIEKRVTAVLNSIDYNAGNIHRMIAEDLASPAAEHELSLLPKLDYCSAQYAAGISDQCKDMLREKVLRYQRQHAHNLALDGLVDIVLKWDCSAKSPQPVRELPENEVAHVDVAHRCRYKYLDRNAEHADEKEHDHPAKVGPGECRKPRRADKAISSPPATHKGGFYACVIPELLCLLQNLSGAWKATVEVVVAAKLMTEKEQEEMDAYHESRRQAMNANELEKALAKVQAERWAEEDKRIQRAKPAFPRGALVQRTMRDLGI
ncbi:hypothetical protein BU23DRAFT_651658 [Bimuria novae-zelandiae CBS 107.79]|uniref:Uncharacterized protein n=1 Tax=Bimuria novae-zelandiae CBS 107.79 TaxID=1447943 RepID=A0A6A5UXW0_9PLEO|nr:hypothetical protein BU23DRAFT_651658 [Bimuria novae-zelandiae CBS 107.79]